MPARSRHASPFIAAIVIVAIFLAAALPLICSKYSAGRAAEDQNQWHLPVIIQFAREWPHPNLSDYRSATTPGYHLTLAVASRIVGSSDERILRSVGLVFTIALLATLAVIASRRGTVPAIILCLPLVTSLYIFSSGVWLLPDNAGWLGVLLAMMLALRRRVDIWTYVGAAILIFLLVLIRQIDLWVAAPIFASVWIGCDDRPIHGQGMDSPLPVRAKRGMFALLAFIPAVTILLIFFHLWHGLVPPDFNSNRAHDIPGAGEHTGGNPAAVALELATFALFSPFYLGWMRDSAPVSRASRPCPASENTGETPGKRNELAHPPLGPTIPNSCFAQNAHGHLAVGIGSLFGIMAGLLPPTSYDVAAGRWSGLWRVASLAPTVANRSLVIALLSTIGGGLLGYFFSILPRRDRRIFLTAWIAFGVAQMANRQAWQRYFDPFVLITLILVASRAGEREADDLGKLSWTLRLLPVALAVLLAIITYKSLVVG